MHGQRSTASNTIAPEMHALTAGLSIAGANAPGPVIRNPKLTLRADHQVVPTRTISGFHFIGTPLAFRDDFSNAISMNAASSTCPTGKAVALFSRTSHALGATAPGSRGTHQYDCPLGLDIDTCASLVERQADAARPPCFSYQFRMRAAGSGRRPLTARSGRVARTTGAHAHANSIRGTGFVVGMNMDSEAPCWSEIAQGGRRAYGTTADTGDVTIVTANAGMIEMNSCSIC
jgi:hypothetical protein